MRLFVPILLAFQLWFAPVMAEPAGASLCMKGMMQSPADLSAAEPARLAPLAILYEAEALKAAGRHTPVAGKHILRAGTAEYRLEAIGIHAPALHPLAGSVSPAEIVFWHVDAKGRRAALSVRIVPGEASKAAELFLKGGAERLFLRDLLPESREYYRYEGSAVLPPCREDVTWFVMEAPSVMSGAEIAALTALAGPSGRPLQPRNNRMILKSGGM